jgi:hypothetical protein
MVSAFLALALPWSFESAAAQRQVLSFDVRGSYGFPIGDFGDNAGYDFGFGAGALLSFTPSFGVYGGWARDSFGCDNLLCDEGSQLHVSGFEVGGKFMIPTANRILPWLKAGLVAHKTTFDAGSIEFESDRTLGFQAAGGLDFPLGDVLSVSPGLRFTMLENDQDGFFSEPEVRFLSFDLGLHIHIPRN